VADGAQRGPSGGVRRGEPSARHPRGNGEDARSTKPEPEVTRLSSGHARERPEGGCIAAEWARVPGLPAGARRDAPRACGSVTSPITPGGVPARCRCPVGRSCGSCCAVAVAPLPLRHRRVFVCGGSHFNFGKLRSRLRILARSGGDVSSGGATAASFHGLVADARAALRLRAIRLARRRATGARRACVTALLRSVARRGLTAVRPMRGAGDALLERGRFTRDLRPVDSRQKVRARNRRCHWHGSQ
jgi:hypothetical protein